MSEMPAEPARSSPGVAGEPDAAAEVWQTVASAKLALVFRIRTAVLPIAAVAGAVALGAQHNDVGGITLAVGGLILYTAMWVTYGRRARSWRFRERADDLLIDHGLMFRKQVVVPYGRMQFVDVKVDPLDRMLGIATVQLHTAAAATDARIPGLVPEQARLLRDRLAELGRARMSGL
jgi:uncharacterized protein